MVLPTSLHALLFANIIMAWQEHMEHRLVPRLRFYVIHSKHDVVQLLNYEQQ